MHRILVLVTVVLALGAGPAVAQSGYDLFQKALVKERAVGDVEEALHLYQRIVKEFGGNHALAAKAQLRMGLLYDRLGREAEAQRAFQVIVNQYADQANEAQQARAKIATAAAQPTATTVRQVWTGPNVPIYGSVSPDGRYVSFVDQETGDLALHDLVNGKDRRLTNQGTGPESNVRAEHPVISRDGRQVAYSWRNREGRAELRVIGLEGNGPQPHRVLYDNDDIIVIVPEDWSPDGKWIAVQLRRKDETTQIGLVSATARSLRVLKSVDWRAATSVFFSPEGKYLAFDVPSSENPRQRDVFVLTADGSREIPAVVHPANDVTMGWAPDGKHLLFASDRTGAMGLWALPFGDGKPQGTPKMVKTGIGPSRSLGITRSGALYFGMRTEGSDVYVGSVDFNSGKVLTPPMRPIQEFVGSNRQPDWSPDGKYLAYQTIRDPLGYNHDTIAIRSVETGQTRELRPNLSAFNWPRWAPDGRSFAVQGRDSKGRQGIYRVDAQTAEVSPLVQSLPGDLSANPQWAPDGSRIFYRLLFAGRKGAAIIERDLASGKERELWRGKTPVLYGLSLAPDGRYVAFRTSDPATHESIALAVPVAGGEPRELLRLQAPQTLTGNFPTVWTRDSRSIIFQKTLSATALDREYWLVPLAGGQPRKVDIGMRNGSVILHPDGSHVAINCCNDTYKFEVWVMENFLPATPTQKTSLSRR